MNLWPVLLTLFSLITISLTAEIERVTIKWTPGLCQTSCSKTLQQKLSKMNGVAEVNFNQDGAEANLRWKPTASFSYANLESTMAQIGLSMDDIRIKARGYIKHDEKTVTLVSIGDNTRFVLLGPVIPQKSAQVNEYSVYAHPVSPELRTKLLNAEKANMIAVIEGQLFEPERSPPLLLIAENINFVQMQKDNQKQ